MQFYQHSILKICYAVFSHTCILVHFIFCIITHIGDYILKTTFLNCLKIAARKVCEQYHNMASFPVWLQIQYGGICLFLMIGFRYFVNNCVQIV